MNTARDRVDGLTLAEVERIEALALRALVHSRPSDVNAAEHVMRSNLDAELIAALCAAARRGIGLDIEVARLRTALVTIQGESCNAFMTGLGSCQRNGREDHAEFGAHQTCSPCVAYAALSAAQSGEK